MKKTSLAQRRVAQWAALARKAKLDNPVGRAAYAENRLLNGETRHPLDVMRRCRPTTADRWLERFRSGSSLRSLGTREALEGTYGVAILQSRDGSYDVYDGPALRRYLFEAKSARSLRDKLADYFQGDL